MKPISNPKVAKFAAAVQKFSDKALMAVGSAVTAVSAMGVSAFAADGASGSSASLSSALSQIDSAVVLDGFYQVLPVGLAVALPIVAAKVGIGFFFSLVKGA